MHESTLLRHSRDPVMHQRQLTGQKQPHRQLENDVSCTLVFDDEDCDESEHVAKVSDNRTKPSTTTRGASEQDNRSSSHGWSRGSVTDSRADRRSSSHDVGEHRTPVSTSDVIHRGPSVRLSVPVPENYFSSRKYIDGVTRQTSQRYATTAGRVYPVHRVLQPTSRQGPQGPAIGLDFERHRRIEKWIESSAMAMTRMNHSTACRDVISDSQRHVTDRTEHSHNPATGYNSAQARPDRRQQQQPQQQQLQQQQPVDSAPRPRNNNNNNDDYTKAAAANKQSNKEVYQSLSRRRETSKNRDRHAVDSVCSDWSSDVINLAGSTAGSDSYSTDFTPFEFDHQHQHRSHQQQQQQQQNNTRVSSRDVVAEQQQMKSRTRHGQPRVVPQPAAAVDGPFVARIVIKTEDASNTSLKTDEVAFPVASNRGTDVMSDSNNNSEDNHIKHRDLGPLKQRNLNTRQQEATHSTHTTVESFNDAGDTNFAVSTTPVLATSTVTAATATPVNSSTTPTDKTSALTADSSNATDSNQNLSQQRGKSVPISTIDKEFMKKYCLEKLIYASSHQVPSRRANKKLVPSLLADAEPDILKSHRVSYPPETIERVPSDQQTEVDRTKGHRASHAPSTVESFSSEKPIDFGSAKIFDSTCHEVEEKRKNAATNNANDVTKSPGYSSTNGGHVTKINVASSGHSKKAADGRLHQQFPTQSPRGGSSGTIGSTELSAGSKYAVKDHNPVCRRSSAASHAPGLTVFITHGPESDKPTPGRPESIEVRPKDSRFTSLERMPNNVPRSQTSSSPGLRTRGLPLQVCNNGLDELSDDRQEAVRDRNRSQFTRGDVARQSKSDIPLFSQGGLTIRVTDSTENSRVSKRLMASAPASRNGIGHSDTTGRYDQHRNSRHKQNEMLLTSARHAVRTPVAALNRDVSQLSAVTQPWQPAPRQSTEDDRYQLDIDRYAKRVSSSPRSEQSDSTGSHGRQNSRCTNTINTLDFRSNSLSRQRLVDPRLRVEPSNFTTDDTRLHTATDCLELRHARSSAAALDRAKQPVKSPVTLADNQDTMHESVNADENAARQLSWQQFEDSSSSCSSGGKPGKVMKQPSPKLTQRSSSESSSISTASSDQVQRTPYVMLTDDEDNLLLLDSDNDPVGPQSHDCLTDNKDTGSTTSANPSNALRHNGT